MAAPSFFKAVSYLRSGNFYIDGANVVSFLFGTMLAPRLASASRSETILSLGFFFTMQLLIMAGIQPKQQSRIRNITTTKDLSGMCCAVNAIWLVMGVALSHAYCGDVMVYAKSPSIVA